MGRQLVLFVDDEERVLNSWRRAFAEEPYIMLFAKSAEEAKHIMDGIKISVLVTDFSMPEYNGLVLMTYVKERFPEVKRIMVSGHATVHVASQAVNECDVFRLFEKPCNPFDLGLAIREALGRRYEAFGADEGENELLKLEAQFPGITRVKRGPGGSIEV